MREEEICFAFKFSFFIEKNGNFEQVRARQNVFVRGYKESKRFRLFNFINVDDNFCKVAFNDCLFNLNYSRAD